MRREPDEFAGGVRLSDGLADLQIFQCFVEEDGGRPVVADRIDELEEPRRTVPAQLSDRSTSTAVSTLTVTGTSAFDGVIANGNGTVALTKSTGGTLTLSRTNTYTGDTKVTGGTLSLTATGILNAGSAVSVTGTGTLAGVGTANGTVSVSAGGTLAPGNSPGALGVGGLTLADGGEYNWQVSDAAGAAGTGYDTINATGALNLAGLTTGGFDINLWSLSSTAPDTNGNATGFNNGAAATWTLVATNSTISNFSPSLFDVVVGADNGTGGFSNSLGGGSFSTALSPDGTDLLLTFTPVPEPTSIALLAFGALFLRRRR